MMLSTQSLRGFGSLLMPENPGCRVLDDDVDFLYRSSVVAFA